MIKLNLIPGSKLSFTKGTKVLFTDPCYILSSSLGEEMDKAWSDMCHEMFSNEGREKNLDIYGIIELNGTKFLYTSTAHGDGCYDVKINGYNHEHKYIINNGVYVDSGIFCVVDFKLAKQINPNEYDICGVVVELSKDTEFKIEAVKSNYRQYGAIVSDNRYIVLDSDEQ